LQTKETGAANKQRTLRFTKTRADLSPRRALPPHLVFKSASDVRRLSPAQAIVGTRLYSILSISIPHRDFQQGFKRGAASLRGCSKERRSFEYLIWKKLNPYEIKRNQEKPLAKKMRVLEKSSFNLAVVAVYVVI
jgi:hypothetical protein